MKGMGHIMRLISVAKHLSKVTIQKSFVLLQEDIGATDFIKQEYYDVELHLCKEGIFQQVQYGDIFVLDGYTFGEDDLLSLKERGAKIIYIDDLQHIDLSLADIVINHTPGYDRSDFKLSSQSILYLGPEYSMLRPQFINNQRKRKITRLNEMVVSLGMSNSGNCLSQLVGKLNQVFPDVSIYILPGANKLEPSVLRPNNKVLDVLDANNLSELFRKCDLAVLPLSTLYLEALASGLIVMGGYFVDNQKVVYQKLVNQNILWGLGQINDISISSLENIKSKIEASLPIITDSNFGLGWSDIKSKIEEWL